MVLDSVGFARRGSKTALTGDAYLDREIGDRYSMKAFFIDCYGSNDRVRFGEIPDPQVREDDVLVQIRHTSRVRA